MPSTEIKPGRLTSIDAYRGLVMLLMLAEGLRLCSVHDALPDSGFWAFLCHHQSHVVWRGCSLHDLIQPSFTFLVGVSLPFSLAARSARGGSFGSMMGHALWRSFALVALGVFLRSLGRDQTYFTFEDTLTQIGLGYPLLFLLGFASARARWVALVLILIGYWLAFVLYPLPGPGFDWGHTGVSSDWEHHASGLAAHWNKNTNLAWAFDRWFLNLFPRETPFAYNGGGYATLSFIPTLGTMILGLLAGGWLRSGAGANALVKRFAVAALGGWLLGWVLDVTGLCPNVKRIWTPAWVLFSGGWCFALLAAFYWVTDVRGWKVWAFPLIVVGMNSIFAYCSEWLFAGFFHDALNTHLGGSFFNLFGETYHRLFEGAVVLALIWGLLYWLYRKRIFIKI